MDLDYTTMTDRELALLATYGRLPEIVAAARAEQKRRQSQPTPEDLSVSRRVRDILANRGDPGPDA